MNAPVDLADYDAVVSSVYDAALSPARWDMALTSLMARFGGDRWDNAMLLWEGTHPPAGRFLGVSGVHATAQQAYLHAFAGRHEWSLRGHRMPVGSVFHSDDLIEREAFLRTPFFREYLATYDFQVGLIALLDRHETDHLCLCFPGPGDAAPGSLDQAIRRLVPHFQRAARISRRLLEAELAASTAVAALEAAPSAILMCDDLLRVTYANEAGRGLIELGYIALRKDRLVLADAESDRRVRALLRPHSPRCAAFVLERDDRPSLAAMAIRVDPAAGGLHADFGQPRVMIVASRNHRTAFAHVDHLRDWFGLTPAEARLAAALAEGASLEDFAVTRGISLNAVRFLLKGVFAKTETHRQPELVARLQSTPLNWGDGSPNADLPRPL
jgi:DNA-binding CsgD family transcriptional regulator